MVITPLCPEVEVRNPPAGTPPGSHPSEIRESLVPPTSMEGHSHHIRNRNPSMACAVSTKDSGSRGEILR